METVEAYLDRKKQELELLNSLLSDPLPIRLPRSVAEVIEQKFHLAAALKAEHVLHDWASTETAWTHSNSAEIGSVSIQIRLSTGRSRSGRSIILRTWEATGQRDRLHGVGHGRHFGTADGHGSRFLQSRHRHHAEFLW